MPVTCADEIGTDICGFHGSRLHLRQRLQGHRAGTDAVLLAAAAPADLLGLALDVGAGVGAAGIMLAATRPKIRVGLIDNDSDLVLLARENLESNGLADRGFAVTADVLSPQSRLAARLTGQCAPLVITNPPFFDPRHVRVSPHADRRRAHTMPEGNETALADWISAALALVEPGGQLIMINRPEALPVFLDTVAGRAGAVTILPVYPRNGAPAIRVLARARKGSRAPLAIATGLTLHEKGSFTAIANAIHRGTAIIEW